MCDATLLAGHFVRVRMDSDTRAGQDGMAVGPDDGVSVPLVFRYDRNGRSPEACGGVTTGLVEQWGLAELDLTTVER